MPAARLKYRHERGLGLEMRGEQDGRNVQIVLSAVLHVGEFKDLGEESVLHPKFLGPLGAAREKRS